MTTDTASNKNQSLNEHWTIEALGPERAQKALSLAETNPDTIEVITDPEAINAAMCLSFAAADLLEIDEKPHFQESEHGVLTALYTARIRTRLNQTPQYHPYIASCDYLETAAMLSIAGDQDLTERWFEQRNVASSIPAGHYSDEAYHAFHQLVHATIKDLTGLGRNDVKPPCVIAQQTYNVIKAYSGPNKRQVPYSHYRYLLGMKVWAETLGEHRREPNLDRTNIGMSTLDKVVSDLYLTPALSWVRAAYAAINIRREHGRTKAP